MSFPRPTAGPYATGAPAADPRGVPGAGPGPGVCPTPVGRPQRRHSGCCFRGAGMILSGCLWGYSDIMSEYGVAILYLCRCYVFFVIYILIFILFIFFWFLMACPSCKGFIYHSLESWMVLFGPFCLVLYARLGPVWPFWNMILVQNPDQNCRFPTCMTASNFFSRVLRPVCTILHHIFSHHPA